jgi:hypothetical protein
MGLVLPSLDEYFPTGLTKQAEMDVPPISRLNRPVAAARMAEGTASTRLGGNAKLLFPAGSIHHCGARQTPDVLRVLPWMQ